MNDTGNYARDLLHAPNEEAATRILDRMQIDENVEWVSAGSERNYNSAYGNTSDKIGAFAELIVNSFDSVLMKRYKEKYGENYDASTGLITVDDAVNDLLDHPDTPHKDGEHVEIITDGSTDRCPSLIVRDTGGGQSRENFEDRFMEMGVGQQIKDDWPFAQGRFKMGSAAPLPHSGNEGYRLTISATPNSPGEWSWSITRDNYEVGRFEYLLIDGEIGRFEGELSMLNPGDHNVDDRGQTYGTFTKVYDYDLGINNPSKHILIANSLRTGLERTLVDPAFPFRMTENRDYSPDVSTQYVRGLAGRLEKKQVREQIVGNGDMDRHIRHDFGEPLGERRIRVVLFKANRTLENEGVTTRQKRQCKDQFVADSRHIEQAVMYNVNGQAHAYERRSFLSGKRGCGYDHIGGDLIVFMDLSDVADKENNNPRDFLKLFGPSRDQMSNEPIAKQLRSELQQALESDEALKAEEQRRRDRFITDTHDEQEAELIQTTLEQNPEVRHYFVTGERVTATGVSPEADGGEYTAPRYPKYLNIIQTKRRDGDHDIWDEADGMYTRPIPTNRERTVYFDINARNDYFDRENDPGTFEIQRANVKSWSIDRGVLSAKLKPHDGASVGQEERVTALVERPYADPLRRTFRITYTEPVDPENAPTGETDDHLYSENIDPPKIVPVHEHPPDGETAWSEMDWASTGGWGADDIVAVQENDDGYTVYVNMDAAPLHHFNQSKNLTETGKKHVKKVWRMGVMFYSIATHIELSNEGRDPGEIVPHTMRGIAQTMLSQHISDGQLDRLTY